MAELPRGTVAFLFTDIAGSTRLWESHPATMAAAYARHDAILRDAIAAHAGHAYKVVGDAYQAAFATAGSAVAAALAAQRALHAEDWMTLGLPTPLRVRMAVHAGDVAPSEQGDYRSPVLNRLGRLMAAGHGGQVLLSLAAAELARDALPPSVSLRDMGERRLKDLHRTERIYQLLHPELPSDFPPLATLDRRPHNLPVQPTPLIGRGREVTELRTLVDRGARLVTLTGPGGTGKTRLALQLAAELVDVFDAGAFFVPLAAVTHPALVLPAVAGALGIREEGGTPLRDLVVGFLASRQLLLVLDNLEQVVEGAADAINDLIAAAPDLVVVATSRAPLRLRAERAYPVPPLGLPRRKPPPTAEQLTASGAVRLFVDRAQAVRPGFAVTNESAPAIAEICHRLDGLPLAIELAAARARTLTPRAMLAQLEGRLPLRSRGARDLPARQRTLHAAIAWSHDLLDPGERALFRRLAVFVGGFTPAAVGTVAGGTGDGVDVAAGLEALAEQSLIRQEEEPDGDARFTMLETVRAFSAEWLAADPKAAEFRRRHAAWCLALVEDADAARTGPAQGQWAERLEAEHDNLRAALGWTLAEDAEAALRLAAGAWWFWDLRGHLGEGRRWLDRSLAAATGAPADVRARALNGAGRLGLNQGDLASAAALYEESLTLARGLGDIDGVTGTLNNLGNVAYVQGDLTRAAMLYKESLELARGLGDADRAARSLANLGTVAYLQGDLVGAAALHEEGLALARGLGDAQGVAHGLNGLGSVAFMQGDLVRATVLFEESLALARDLGEAQGIANALINLGSVAYSQGELERAGALYEESLALARDLGNDFSVVRALTNLGNIPFEQGDLDRAGLLYEESLALARGLGDTEGSAHALNNLADLSRVRGDRARAADHLREALLLSRELGSEALLATGVEMVTRIAADPREAVRLAGAVASLRENLAMPLSAADQSRHAAHHDELRVALGEAGYSAAWEEGQALLPDEAVEAALALAVALAGDAAVITEEASGVDRARAPTP